MKCINYIFFQVILLFSISEKNFCQFVCNLAGTGFQSYNGTIVEIEYTEYDEYGPERKKMNAKVEKGQFNVSIPLINPGADGWIYFPGVDKQFTLVFDSGNVIISPSPGDKNSLQFDPPSPANKLKQEWSNIKDPRLFLGKNLPMDTIKAIRLKELDWVRKNPGNFYSMITLASLSYMIRSVPPEDLLRVFNDMEYSIRQTKLGNWLNSKLNHATNSRIGNKLPEFTFYTQNGEVLNNKGLDSMPYLIAFSAPWCGPCKKQIPFIKKLKNEFNSSGLRVLYVNLDNNSDEWKKMIIEYGLNTFFNVTDTSNFSKSLMALRLTINALPTNLLIDKNQTIVYNSVELEDFELKQIRSYIESLFL